MKQGYLTTTTLQPLLLGLLLAGCVPPIRPATSVSLPANRRAVLGSPLFVSGDWYAMCTTKHFDKNGPEQERCHLQRTRLEVRCEGECRIEGDRIRVGEKGANVTVVPLALGRMVIHAKSTRLSTGEVDSATYFVEVVGPQRLALGCRGDHHSFAPCGPDGVSAASPMIRPEIYLDGSLRDSRLLRINSVVTPVDRSSSHISLAQLFPEAREGDGVRPGTYSVELSLAGVTERYQVVAR